MANTTENFLELVANSGDKAEERLRDDIRGKLCEIETRRFDADSPPEVPKSIISLNGTGIATPGNLIALSGQAKSAKSHVGAAMLAGAIATQPEDCDLLGLRADNPEGKAVVWIDAEQSQHHFHKLITGACHRAKVERGPEWFYGYCLTGLDPNEVNEYLEAACEVAASRHGGLHFIFLDGFADLVDDPNDLHKSNDLVRWLQWLAQNYQTNVVGVLHHNAQSDSVKMRGHLGSQIERKAETVLCVKKDRHGVRTLFATATRGREISELDGARIIWSDENGMFVSIDTKRNVQAAEKEQEAVEVLASLAGGDHLKTWRHGKLAEAYCHKTGKTESSAKRFISNTTESGLLLKDPISGDYSLGEKVRSALSCSET